MQLVAVFLSPCQSLDKGGILDTTNEAVFERAQIP